MDDIAHQAAADSLLTITRKITTFRGESKFSTWAYQIVFCEVAGKVNRHFWRRAEIRLDPETWERLPDRFDIQPDAHVEASDLILALRHAVEVTLTSRQRAIFVAVILEDIPIDVLAKRLDTNANAIYKAMFDTRRKLRRALVKNGFLPQDRCA